MRRASPASTTHSNGCSVVARTGQQAQLAQGGRSHLLRLIDEQHAAPSGGVQVRQPAFAQGLETAPPVVRAQRDGEDVAELAIEVGQIALRMVDGAHGHV